MLKQRSKRGDILHIFERKYLLDERRAFFAAEHRRHQVPGFRADFLAGHRIFRAAANGIVTFRQRGAVVERDLDHRHSLGQKTLEALIGNDLDLRFLADHGGIVHARLVVRRFERQRFVDEHDRDQILHRQVHHHAVVDLARPHWWRPGC